MNSNRLVSAVVSLNKVRSISGAFARLGQWPGGAALSGWGYRPHLPGCQRQSSTNRRTVDCRKNSSDSNRL